MYFLRLNLTKLFVYIYIYVCVLCMYSNITADFTPQIPFEQHGETVERSNITKLQQNQA